MKKMFLLKNRKIKRATALIFSFIMAAMLVIPSGGFGFTTAVYAAGTTFGANAVAKDSVYAYNFSNGSVVPTTVDSAHRLNGSVVSSDSNLRVTSAGHLYAHDKQHGLAVYDGDTFEVNVAGNAVVTFNLCQYGSDTSAVFAATSTLGTIDSATELLKGAESDGLSIAEFTYTGPATTITFTVKTSNSNNEMYLHGMNVSNLPEAQSTPTLVGNGKIDVWDFGAAQLDTAKYNNMLTDSIMNSWYPASTAAGSTGIKIGSFGTDELKFVAQGSTDNTIITSNTKITRADTCIDVTANGKTFSGKLSSNSSNPTNSLDVKAYKNDIITVYAGTTGNQSTIWCVSPTGKVQKQEATGIGTKLTFYASEYGLYKCFSSDDQLIVYRVERTHTQPVKVSGAVDLSKAAGLASADYRIDFTNKQTGEVTKAVVTGGNYSVYLNEQYDYDVTLENAQGCIITSERELSLAAGAGNTTFPVAIKEVDRVTVTGQITGLTADALAKLKLSFVNNDQLYVPETTISGTTFTVKLEKGVTYKIQADNINDYELSDLKTITETADATQNIAFALKPTYQVGLTLTGLPASTISHASVTFTNVNEAGYSYTFKATDIIKLRDGQYHVVVKNIGDTASLQAATTDIKVNGANITKTINFDTNTLWDFSKLNGNPGIETIDSAAYYSGLQLSGSVGENKIYLQVNPDGQVKIPAKKGDVVKMSYCYCGAFSVNGVEAADATSGSTSQIDKYQYTATEDGFVTIKGITGKNAAQTYFTSISVITPIPYVSKINVGADKEYKTINDALTAASRMVRTDDERVEIMIDPGNYEEMLTIDVPNVTLENAAGSASSLEVTNSGVDIADNAVRITSYYGHGYSYYSMNSSSKYDAATLAANKENGYVSTVNPGSGTTNGSFWNATVVVNGSGFEADGIIFENSYNQYISKKEAADTVVEWATGGKGTRPTTYGDTSVQNGSFVERAAAIAVNGDKSVFNGCKFIGRQDTLYGDSGIKALFQKCDILGGTDYIFGGFISVFYQCNLTMNTNDADAADVAYITAAQQSGGRGYLMYNCNITSTTPGLDTASKYRSKPGYFGRPWASNTSEVVYYKTVVGTTDYPDNAGQSLILPVGWNNSLGGQSVNMYEFGTMEASGVNNTASRVAWATTLTTPVLNDKTAVSIASFLGDWAKTLQAKGLAIELNESQLETPETVTGTTEERQMAFNSLATDLSKDQALSSNDYTADSFAVLTQAIKNAKALTSTSSVGTIKAAQKALADAVAGLVKSSANQPSTPTNTNGNSNPAQDSQAGTTAVSDQTVSDGSQTDGTATASSGSVKTGDNSFVLFYEFMLFGSLAAGVLLVIVAKKRKLRR
jgi:exo-poly-alpha-galacturonosidase